jgi:ATP-dependent Clp protease adaptor protein ClpS
LYFNCDERATMSLIWLCFLDSTRNTLPVFNALQIPACMPLHSAVRDCYMCAMAKTPARHDDRTEQGVLTRAKPKTKKPSMYKVLLLNDDYTPMEFVVMVLEQVFNKSREDAHTIMLHVHQKGVGVCGIYTYEVAETKVMQVMDAAKRASHPLQCTMEKE